MRLFIRVFEFNPDDPAGWREYFLYVPIMSDIMSDIVGYKY